MIFALDFIYWRIRGICSWTWCQWLFSTVHPSTLWNRSRGSRVTLSVQKAVASVHTSMLGILEFNTIDIQLLYIHFFVRTQKSSPRGNRCLFFTHITRSTLLVEILPPKNLWVSFRDWMAEHPVTMRRAKKWATERRKRKRNWTQIFDD